MTSRLSAAVAAVPKPKRNTKKGSQAKKKPDLEVVEPGRGIMSYLAPIALASIIAVLLLMAMFHALVVQGQRELDRIQADIDAAETVNDQLHLQLAEAEAPQRIVAAARDLGMVDAPEVVYLVPDNSSPAFSQSPAGSAEVE